MKKSIQILSVLLVLLSFAGCTKNADSQLKGDWKIVSMKTGAETVSFSNSSISFNASENRFNGRGPCNNFDGIYTVNGDRIDLKNMASTLVGCYSQTESIAEAALFRLLDEAKRFKVESGKLYLMDGDNYVLCESK